jgi:hypothetical protein
MTRIWTPITEGEHTIQSNVRSGFGGKYLPAIAEVNQDQLTIKEGDWGYESITCNLPANMRLCELVDAAPVPLDMPDEVRDTIRGLLESGIVGTKSAIRGRDYHGLRSFNEEDWLRRYQEALAWLDTQPWQAQPSEEDK